jgi:hypothetical protein
LKNFNDTTSMYGHRCCIIDLITADSAANPLPA